MKTQDIHTLLDRYYEGETTLEEERTLRAYFSGKEVAEELASHRALFAGLQGMKTNSLSGDFEQKLLERLEEKPQARIRSLQPYLLRVAAAIAIVLSVWFLMPRATQPGTGEIDWTAYEVSEEQSVEEAVAALRLLSEKLNSGKKKVKTEMNHMDRVVDPLQ